MSHRAPPKSVSESLLRALEPGAPLPSPHGSRRTGPLADAAPSKEHSLAFCGYGTVLPISELIGFLGTIGKSGILRVNTADQSFVLEFLEGHIVHGEATCAPPGLRLGDLLVTQGVITRASLESALALCPTRRLGEALLEMRLIDKEHLTGALRTQIQWLFSRLFREEVKSFTFWIGPPLQAGDGVRLNVNSLLLEGARLSDEGNEGSDASQDDRLSRTS